MAAVMPAATARQAAPVARKEPVPGRWCFPPTSGIAQFDELLDGGARTRCHLCAGQACMWAAVGGRHTAFHASCIFLHPAFQPQLRSRMSMISLYFHSTQSASPAVCTMHTAFLHYAFHTDPQLRSRRPKLHSALHVSHSAFHQSCIPHPGSLTAVPGCAGTFHRYRA